MTREKWNKPRIRRSVWAVLAIATGATIGSSDADKARLDLQKDATEGPFHLDAGMSHRSFVVAISASDAAFPNDYRSAKLDLSARLLGPPEGSGEAAAEVELSSEAQTTLLGVGRGEDRIEKFHTKSLFGDCSAGTTCEARVTVDADHRSGGSIDFYLVANVVVGFGISTPSSRAKDALVVSISEVTAP